MTNHNLGKLDRIFRFVLGIVWLSPLAPQFDNSAYNMLIFIVALIALIESFLGWCWLHTAFGIDNKNQ
ncbi:MAG: hypothetical protein UU82_C0031G0003 [Candidatus Nomurabacteria bacterium GW2011_GWC2_41_8]|uniref:Inner membrane protein YgaP-like transmembrane domain-containing protein n=2 Tax=Candidatus Nomuraibacteriota TaxID=1752729 RepID=A0A1F6YAB2_9BACT|nr:MAG: hypothetical protein UU82_C0031G0003 [Candidatus Nomurabacteria bacterium GW2011_GWC2_41_8]OGI66584.1 MAG: hypothetical protein A2823_00510 [Candidatus Nomurabacteria bacterium RIFCSPHIGHO2_01_FULL_41_91]OGI80730.1 MAG: hypothetical protein A3D43_02545 [Candidatus Nomurabacteria bacterium RIFCSPHIGHO2_02_FULL_41_52]OGI84632.1 MAG: hypothetical protein A3F49_02220 [Candidatus Nomurabacteria bacterium RIFCSPHIGHO2_12_FULL_42_19]OGI94011.1 MAG: hypothetical protein A3A07_00790 [Candidatus 